MAQTQSAPEGGNQHFQGRVRPNLSVVELANSSEADLAFDLATASLMSDILKGDPVYLRNGSQETVEPVPKMDYIQAADIFMIIRHPDVRPSRQAEVWGANMVRKKRPPEYVLVEADRPSLTPDERHNARKHLGNMLKPVFFGLSTEESTDLASKTLGIASAVPLPFKAAGKTFVAEKPIGAVVTTQEPDGELRSGVLIAPFLVSAARAAEATLNNPDANIRNLLGHKALVNMAQLAGTSRIRL